MASRFATRKLIMNPWSIRPNESVSCAAADIAVMPPDVSHGAPWPSSSNISIPRAFRYHSASAFGSRDLMKIPPMPTARSIRSFCKSGGADAARLLRRFHLTTNVAGNEQCRDGREADDDGTDPHCGHESCDVRLRREVRPVRGEDRGEDCDAEHASDLADRVVGTGCLALFLGPD